MNLFKQIAPTQRNLVETGLLMILLDLLWAYFYFGEYQILVGIFLVGATILIPQLFYPVAWVLLVIGRLLNLFIPKILLGVIFYWLVTPVGLIRRILGKDSLQLRKFKENHTSVFIDKPPETQKSRIEQPF